MTASRRPTACVLIIGNEILSGRTQDVNLRYLARRLNELGVYLGEARVIADDERAIVDAVNRCRVAFDYVLTTGGIGPTHDDITAGCIAKAFGVALEENPEARRLIADLCRKNGVELNPARLRMALIPRGARLIGNPVSAAPGFRIDNVFVLAGVPAIMQAMFEGFKDQLAGGPPLHSRTVVGHLPEGTLAGPLADLQARFPDVEIGSYPARRDGRFVTSLVLRGSDRARLSEVCAAIAAVVEALGGDPEVESE